MHIDRQPEPVQQLRTQFALFGIHGADQHEAGLVAVRYAVTLDMHPAHRRGVEQHVDEVVMQKVDLVDVEHPAVGTGQQSRREGVFPVAQDLLQVQRSDHAVLGGADRQFDQRRTIDRAQHRGKAAHGGRLRGALLAADQHSPDLGSHRAQQQCEPQPVVSDDRAERIPRGHDFTIGT